MIETRIMNENDRKELEGDVKTLKVLILICIIILFVITAIYLWFIDKSELEIYGTIISMSIIFIILIVGGYWEAKIIKKDIENGVIEVIKGTITKETKYKFRKYQIEVDHEIVNLGRPVYIDWLKKGKIIEIVRAPISRNYCRVVTNGEEVYPFKSKQSNAADRSKRAI